MSATQMVFRPLRYYRWTLLQVRRLPEQEHEYYRQYCRSQFMGHSDEVFEDRIEEVAQHGLNSVEWVLRKYELDLHLAENEFPWR